MKFLTSNEVVGQSLQIGYVRLSALKDLENVLWQNNSKLHDLDLIYQSILKYGFIDTPLWDTNLNGGKGALVYGNGRSEALVLGLSKAESESLPIPKGIVTAANNGEWCIPIGFGMDQESEMKAIALALDHNNLTISAARGMDALDAANMWEEEDYLKSLQMLHEEDSLPLTVDEDDYAYLMANLGENEDEPEAKGSEDLDENGEPEIFRVELGDVWALGSHRILCGDSTDAALLAFFMDFIKFDKADIILTDPPYGVEYSGTKSKGFAGTDVKIENDFLAEDELLTFLVKAFKNVIFAGKPGIPFYCFTPQGELSFTFYTAMNHLDIKINQQLIWVKQHFSLGRSHYHYQHEPIYYTSLPGTAEKQSWQGSRSESSIFEYDKPSSNRQHPTMKPVELLEDILKNSSAKNDIIFDPFLGSGSTLLTAQKLGLRLFGLELMPKYASVTIDRWEEQTGMTATKLGSLSDFMESLFFEDQFADYQDISIDI